jgi:N-acetyl-alpha-D-muramate 1-phosphate uridylyltransferase
VKAILLAAGRGERMRPLTDALPKPLLPVAGRPLIVWHLEALRRAGIREVVINTSWLAPQLHAALGDGHEFGVVIRWSDEGPVALETAGGIIRALPLLGPEPFLVVSGDIWTDIDFGGVRLGPGALAHLVLVENPPHHLRGDFALTAGGEVVERDSGRFTYANVGLYTHEFFAGCAPGRVPLVEPLRRAIAGGRVRGELHRGAWCDVGTPARLAELEAKLARVQ